MSADEEILAKLNNQIYVAPCGVLYVEHFKNFVVGNVIDIDAMNALGEEERFKLKNLLLDFICKTLVCVNWNEESEYKEDLDKICGRMDGASRVINYLGENKRFDEAFVRMDKFLTDALVLSERMFGKKR